MLKLIIIWSNYHSTSFQKQRSWKALSMRLSTWMPKMNLKKDDYLLGLNLLKF